MVHDINGNSTIKTNFIVLIVLILLSYPLFYFSYKFCLPDFGGEDYYAYQYLYKDWNFAKVPSPFNMRIISSFCVYIINHIGLDYNTETVFSVIHPAFSRQVFFNAVLFNYACVVATCFVVYQTILSFANNKFFALVGGCVYLLGFGTLFFALKPMSDSCGIFLMAIAFYFYSRKKYTIFLVLIISVFQREYIFIVFSIISLVEYFFVRQKYYLWIFIGSALCFIIYYVLRKTLFYTPHFESQTSPAVFVRSLFSPSIDWFPFFKQTLFISNLFFIYIFVIVYKKINHLTVNKIFLIAVLILLLQVILMSIMAHFGNNAGRYFYFISPILIFYLFIELKPLVERYFHFINNV